MLSIRSRLTPAIQLFILIIYFVLIFIVKHIYDNNQKSYRFDKYKIMLNEVARTLEVVEKHAKETAQAFKAIETVFNLHKKSKLNDQDQTVLQDTTFITKLKPP